MERDHIDHDAGDTYPEEPDQRCRYLGNDLWSCGWVDSCDSWGAEA